MRISKTFVPILFVFMASLSLAQNEKTNSETRRFIENAEITQINKDWSVAAEFKSGLGEVVSFFPVEAIDLKTNNKVRSLQMDMTVLYQFGGKNYNYFKSSWIDLDEIDEFVNFIEQYVVPNLKDKTDNKQSITYIFNSKEITFSFHIERNKKRISIYLKNNGITDDEHYFWTESQTNKIPDLLTMLKQLK